MDFPLELSFNIIEDLIISNYNLILYYMTEIAKKFLGKNTAVKYLSVVMLQMMNER